MADSLTAWLLDAPGTRVPIALVTLGVLLVLPLLAFAAYMARLGGRAIESRRFPPQGYKTLRPQDALTGDAAVARGRISRILAMLLAAGAIPLVVVLWRLGSLLSQRT